MIKKLYKIFYDFGKQLQRDNVAAYASSTAFFFFLSIVPILLIVCSIITHTPITEDQLINAVGNFVPQATRTVATAFVTQMYNEATSILPVFIIVAIWSAGKGMMGLQMGLNVAHDVVETRNFIIIRLQASIYTLITLFALVIMMAFSMLGKTAIRLVDTVAPHIADMVDYFIRYRFLLSWVPLMVIFTIIYTFLPNKKLKLRYQIPGAFFSSIGWSAYSMLFSMYMDRFDGMSIYGSLSTIVVLFIWLYFSIYLLLIGANLNHYFKPVIKVLFKKRNNDEAEDVHRL